MNIKYLNKNKIVIGIVVIFSIIIGMAVVLYIKRNYREEANMVHPCILNLRQIGAACIMYSNENQGSFAPELTDYMQKYVTDSTLFYCLNNDKYIYLPNINGKDKQNTPLAFCPISHNNGRYILYSDGRVEGVSKEKFKTILKELLARKNIEKELSKEKLNSLNQILLELKKNKPIKRLKTPGLIDH